MVEEIDSLTGRRGGSPVGNGDYQNQWNLQLKLARYALRVALRGSESSAGFREKSPMRTQRLPAK
jgi:hypothetical protein